MGKQRIDNNEKKKDLVDVIFGGKNMMEMAKPKIE